MRPVSEAACVQQRWRSPASTSITRHRLPHSSGHSTRSCSDSTYATQAPRTGVQRGLQRRSADKLRNRHTATCTNQPASPKKATCTSCAAHLFHSVASVSCVGRCAWLRAPQKEPVGGRCRAPARAAIGCLCAPPTRSPCLRTGASRSGCLLYVTDYSCEQAPGQAQ